MKDYCAKTNGYTAGSSGKKYLNICPKDLEPAFLPEYRRGRKKYVQAMIESRQYDVNSLEGQISVKRNNLSFAQGQMSMLQSQKSSLESQKSFTPAGDLSRNSMLDARINQLENEMGTLRSSIYSAENEISTLESQRNGKLGEITEFRAELPGWIRLLVSSFSCDSFDLFPPSVEGLPDERSARQAKVSARGYFVNFSVSCSTKPYAPYSIIYAKL